MSTEKTRDLALKIMGLYHIINTVIYLPQLVVFFAPWGGMSEGLAMVLHYFSGFLSVVLAFVIGWLLTFRTVRVVSFLWPTQAGEMQTGITGKPSLSFWIAMIGLYFFVRSAGGAASEVLGFFFKNEGNGNVVMSYGGPSQLITLVLAVVCILKSPQIEAFLLNRVGGWDSLDDEETVDMEDTEEKEGL